jgi:hypothetical protein
VSVTRPREYQVNQVFTAPPRVTESLLADGYVELA